MHKIKYFMCGFKQTNTIKIPKKFYPTHMWKDFKSLKKLKIKTLIFRVELF